MAKHMVINLKLQPGEYTMGNMSGKLDLPDGCCGILFAYESKRAAIRDGCKRTQLVRIREVDSEKAR